MRISITIEGTTPLLMNRFHEAAQDAVSSSSSMTLRGSKGTPREQATPRLYTDNAGKPVIPGPNIFSCLIQAGTFLKSGKSKLSTQKSSLIPAGVSLEQVECPISPAKWEIDSRAVVIPSTGGRVMAHRPRFDSWQLSFTVVVDQTMFDERLIRELVDKAGQCVGLGDFRPARKGPFGKFKVISWKSSK